MIFSKQKDMAGLQAGKLVPIITDYKLLSVSALIVWFSMWVTNSALSMPWIFTFSILVFVVAILCLLVTRVLRKSVVVRPFIEKRYLKYRSAYLICMTLYMAVIGLWGLACILTKDTFAISLSVMVILGHVAAVSTLNYFLPTLLYSQISVLLLPLIGGLLYVGGNNYSLILVLAPFLWGMHIVVAKLQYSKLNNRADREKVNLLVGQLNNTLENIPHGICMFDSDGNLEISNRHITMVIGRSPQSLKGMSIFSIIKLLEESHSFSSKDADLVRQWINTPFSRSFTLTFEMKAAKTHYIKFRGQRMENNGIIATFEDVTHEMQTTSMIDRLTRFDRLTGLINREQLSTFIDEQLKLGCTHTNNKCAVILMNVNSFKDVHNVMGYSMGDSLLRAITKRLSRITNGMATCARASDDEFVVVLSAENHQDFAVGMADLIHEQMDRPFNINGNLVHVKFSIGIALQINENCDSESLLRRAKVAMTVARQESEGTTWRLYDDAMDHAMQRRRQLEEDLRIATENNQFETYFQPLMSIHSNCVTVCESLLRWNHPEHGIISPAEFVPIAEEMGLINEIGAWVLMESCKACASWPKGTRVAVNLSPRQFEDGKLFDTVCNVLEVTGLESTRLELEITESLMLSNMVETIAVLKKLKKKGIHISLDDFGTGYSSLNYMHDLPLDKVKIDRSFIVDLHEKGKSMTLVQAIATLSHNLGLRVVVEGVETEKQLDVLLSNVSVDEIQGYLFSRPVSKDQARILLKATSPENKEMVSKMMSVTSRAA